MNCTRCNENRCTCYMADPPCLCVRCKESATYDADGHSEELKCKYCTTSMGVVYMMDPYEFPSLICSECYVILLQNLKTMNERTEAPLCNVCQGRKWKYYELNRGVIVCKDCERDGHGALCHCKACKPYEQEVVA